MANGVQANIPEWERRLGLFFSSGVFFMLFGACFLSVAFYTIGNTHASLTFVFVVVGVAILLYGTGTQGIGSIDGAHGSASYNVAIAGGAGLLAFATGFGIVYYADDMRGAFQTERKYVRVFIEPESDGVTSLQPFLADVSVNGRRVPSLRDGESLEILVPYTLDQVGSEFSVDVYFHRIDDSPLLASQKRWRDTIVVDHDIDLRDGSDFPRHRKPMYVNLQERRAAASQLEQADQGRAPDSEADQVPALDGVIH